MYTVGHFKTRPCHLSPLASVCHAPPSRPPAQLLLQAQLRARPACGDPTQVWAADPHLIFTHHSASPSSAHLLPVASSSPLILCSPPEAAFYLDRLSQAFLSSATSLVSPTTTYSAGLEPFSVKGLLELTWLVWKLCFFFIYNFTVIFTPFGRICY